MCEGGVAAMRGLSWEVNAGVLGASYAALALHEATAIWDVVYGDLVATCRQPDSRCTDFWSGWPLMSTVLHWDQART
jgi:hypothetical protein